MRQKIRKALFGGPAGGVFRGMTTLAIGGVAARVIGILSFPIITRLYSPHDFGIAALMLALTGMLAPFLTLRYSVPIALPRSNGAAMNLVVLSALSATFLVLLFSLALFLFGPTLLTFGSMEDLAPWWWVAALGLLASASYEILAGWGVRHRAYRVLSQAQITQSFSSAAVKVGGGLLTSGPVGLLLGGILASGGGSGRMLRAFLPEFRAAFRSVTLSRMRRMAVRYRDFPLYRLPSQILLTFAMQAPLFFSAALFDPATTGQLGLAMQVMALPISLIAQTIGSAYYAEVASMGKRQAGRILEVSKVVQKRLFLIGLLPTLIVTFWGPTLFSLIFGAGWHQAGEFASWLALYMLFQVTSTPMMQVFNLLDNQRAYLLINLMRLVLLGGLYAFCRYVHATAEVYVASYSAIMVAFYLIVSGYVFLELTRAARSGKVAPSG
ncbi:polysaccharide biosynthesis protein [Haematobacter missouriensis]|uniref:Polysaccharide biosynthesis protein n=1 Tax=Haematobacter missouriensis TaxID=366616 RepID=A0A212ARN2_9RHOB|nr:lipopolysaccharide biosynthesis protein [Haematobacter missouriensis]OWJ84095.1 polysaccharide biosynthesis protein [Haematobacter missouriensis]